MKLLIALVLAFGLLQVGVLGAVTLTAVDDANPAFTYLPATHWNSNGDCRCSAKPDAAQMFANTWHDGARLEGDPPVNVTLTFTGVGVSIYGVLWDPKDSDLVAGINLSFSIDNGASTGAFIRDAIYSRDEVFTYGRNMFSVTGLSSGPHTLVINLEVNSIFLFDRADIIVNTLDSPSTTVPVPVPTDSVSTTAAVSSILDHGGDATQTTVMPNPAPSESVIPSQSKPNNSPAIIGGTFGGIAVLTIIVAANVMIRRRRTKRDSTLLPLTGQTGHPPPSPSIGQKSWTLIQALAWEGDLQGFQFLNKESICTLSDIGVSSKWFCTVSRENLVFTSPQPNSLGVPTTESKVIMLNIPKRTVYELSYHLDDPNQRNIAHVLSPDGNMLLRWRKLHPAASECIIEAADAATNKFVRRLTSEAQCHIPDIRATVWANRNTVYIPDSGRKVIIRWSVAPDGLESALIHPCPAVTWHRQLRFHITPDEKWWVANGWTPGAHGGGNGLVEIHDIAGRRSKVVPGAACCIARIEMNGSMQSLLAIADLAGDKLLFKVEQLGSTTTGQAFEPIDVSVELLDPADSPQLLVAFEHLPIIAVVTTNHSLYFFELHTGTYLFSQSMSPDLVWYGTSDGQSVLIHQTQKDRVYRVFVNTDDLIGYVRQILKNDSLASGLALKTGLPGAEDIIATNIAHRPTGRPS
ncbi:hypothetical protein FRC03_010628 [Tulasnella sp. 419]|nr:hypothetical protein FRC02_012427 [Tulasnella sp. 418]KAG8957011.1 hypothetical protein FRC03_010628 [Tulasnella sp. 419]